MVLTETLACIAICWIIINSVSESLCPAHRKYSQIRLVNKAAARTDTENVKSVSKNVLQASQMLNCQEPKVPEKTHNYNN